MGRISAGKLDRRIRIERSGLVEDEFGDKVPGFTPLATVWAQLIPGQGSERLASAEVAATAPMTFVIRWSSTVADVDPRDRVRYPASEDGRVYGIQRVEEIGRREGLRILAVARAD